MSTGKLGRVALGGAVAGFLLAALARAFVAPATVPSDGHVRGHEQSDASVVRIAALGVALLVAFLASFVIVSWLFARFTGFPVAINPPGAGTETPQPQRSQAALPQPLGELAALRQREDRLLHGYAWVDRQAGIVRIPIDDAIDLVASRGLPARADRAQPPEPVPSASGRFVRERPR